MEDLTRNNSGEAISHELETGSPIKRENRLTSFELEKLGMKEKTKIECFYLMLDLIKSGLAKGEILGIIKSKYSRFKENTVEDLFVTSLRFYSDEFVIDSKPVIAIHLERYRKMIEDIDNYDYESVHPKVRFKVMVMHQHNILEILFGIEKLLQLHRKDINIKITQKNNTVIVKPQEVKNDISRLNFTEKIQLLKLLEKSRRTDDEVFIQQSKVDYEEAEIISEEKTVVTNVEVMKDIKDKKEDETQKPKPKKSLLDIQNSLLKRFEEIAEKELKEKGSKL